MNAIIRFQPNAAKPTILGRRLPQLPVGGVVRAGIQVLTKSAKGNPAIKSIYDVGVAAGLSFKAIEKQIYQAVPELKKKPLYPTNTPWFLVRRSDFQRQPEIAEKIMEKYGSVREDGVRRLWELPIVFPIDQWEMVMPHTYQSFTASGLKYWSEFDTAGALRCMTFEPVPIDPTTKRAIKTGSGRRHILRPDNGGMCDPSRCPQYQRKECSLRGKLYFFVPGIFTLDLIQFSTGSIYGMEGVRSRMAMVSAARNGKLSGFLNESSEEDVTFILTKQLMEVAGLDEETGEPIRRELWVPTLTAKIDMSNLYRTPKGPLLTNAGAQAAAVLSGVPASTVYVIPDGVAASGATVEPEGVTRITESAPAEPFPEEPAARVERAIDSRAPAQASSASASPPASAPTPVGSKTTVEQIYTLLDKMGIEHKTFEEYAQKKWNTGWKLNALGLKKAYAEIEAHQDDAAAYVRKLTGELSFA